MIIAYGISNLFVDITTGFSMARKNINGLSTAVIATVLSLLANVAVAEELLYFVHNDHRGAPVAITDESQTIVWKADYKPFGEVELTTETVDFPLRLPGQYHDRESGYYYNYYRDYDPTLGRYIQSDPIGLAGGLNTYAYVGGNPLSYIDPLGLSALTFDRSSGTITVTNGNGETVGTYPASNNAARSSNGPFPDGTHSYSHHSPHEGEGANDRYGSNGNFVFNVPNRTGMGVHSGRANSCDLAGRCGSNSTTMGCIRTTDEATRTIRDLHFGGDPITTITVR